jgi:hypothetical protein
MPAPEQGGFSFLWDFGDGTTATGATASHTFTAGSFPVQLTISDGLYTAVSSFDLKVFSLAIPESSPLVTQLEYFFDVDPGPVTKEEPPAHVSSLEYFFDQPGAPGSGASLALTHSAEPSLQDYLALTPSAEPSLQDSLALTPSPEIDLTAHISLAELHPGVHRIFFRATNTFGLQSPLISRPLLVTPPPAPITAGGGFHRRGSRSGKWPLLAPFSDLRHLPVRPPLPPGGALRGHRLFARAKNSHQIWSAPVSAPFTIEIPRQQLSFTTGWNLFSSYILPGNSDLLSLFQPLIDSMKLIKVLDSQGRSLEYAGDPAQWVNTIGNMLPDQGYKVKMAAPAALTLPGTPTTLPLAIPLAAGWNTVGFPRGVEADGMAVIRQLIDRRSLIKVQDEKGHAIENLGDWGGWHNSIGTFRSGEGYRIHVSQPDTLTIFPSYPFTP